MASDSEICREYERSRDGDSGENNQCTEKSGRHRPRGQHRIDGQQCTKDVSSGLSGVTSVYCYHYFLSSSNLFHPVEHTNQHLLEDFRRHQGLKAKRLHF